MTIMMITTMPAISPPVCHMERLERATASDIGIERLNMPNVSPT